MILYYFLIKACLIIQTYVLAITIQNFNPVNITELKRLVGQDVDKFLYPMLQRKWKTPVKKVASAEVPEAPPPVFRDEKKNVFFDVWLVRGRENRLMTDSNGQLCVSIQSSPDVHDSLNNELWRFFSNLLQVRRDEIEIILSDTNDMVRRVLVKGRALTDRECRRRLAAYRQPFTLDVLEEAGAEESAKLDQVHFHAETRADKYMGPPPQASEEDDADVWSPRYVKNPTMLDRVLRDLMPNQEIIVRGRLIKQGSPNFVARPLLEDYQNKTHDFVDELDYTEVQYKASI